MLLQNVWSWRGISIFLLAVVFLQFYLIISEKRGGSYSPPLYKSPTRPRPQPWTGKPLKAAPLGKWTYEAGSDTRNTGLSQAQCDAAFPDLYFEIDRAVKVWTERKHTISQADIEIDWRADAAFQVIIYDNQLRILRTKNTYQNAGYRKRTLYVLSQLQRALLGAAAAGESLPNVEFAVTVDDMSLIPNPRDDTHSIWAFTRRLVDGDQDRLWLMPDFNFYASPPVASSYAEMQRRARERDANLTEKIPKAVWRGVVWTNEVLRGRLLDAATNGEGEERTNKEWADVEGVDWENPTNVMRMEDLCRYAFVVHTEGRSWSGRLKFLLNCDSLPIIHKLDWTSHFYHLLTPSGPDQNYIHVKRDFSDLEEKVTRYLKDPKEAQRIADNAVATFRERYTSPAAEACYWRRMIEGWSQVAFEPAGFVGVKVNVSGEEIEEQQLRGITYEEFMLVEGNYPADV